MEQECDRALRRIDNEQEKMRLFHENVRSKFSDLMKSGLLFDDEYGDDEDEVSRTKTLTNGPVRFSLNGDHIPYDEQEPQWGQNRNPRHSNMRSSAIDVLYNAPEMSNTVFSLPSDRRLYGDQSSIRRHNNSFDATAVNDYERRRDSDAQNDNEVQYRKITDWNESLSPDQ